MADAHMREIIFNKWTAELFVRNQKGERREELEADMNEFRFLMKAASRRAKRVYTR